MVFIKKKVVIYDTDKEYRERFSDYLMTHRGMELELAVFSNETFLFDALSTDTFQLVVLGCGYEDVLTQTMECHIPMLILVESVQNVEKETAAIEGRILYTGKYQSMDVIVKQMQLLAEEKWGQTLEGIRSQTMEVIGVFSPIRHEMQMLFSMLYAKNAGREKKVLYLNLMEFSGFSELFGESEYDLGDVIVWLREHEVQTKKWLECMEEAEGFSYISPFLNPENVREFSAADIKKLLELLNQYTDYQMVVLDISMNLTCFQEVLQMCSKLFCLGKQGYLFEIQMRQFLSYMERAVNLAFAQCIQQILLPAQIKVVCGGQILLEQLDWGEFGDFVRTQL